MVPLKQELVTLDSYLQLEFKKFYLGVSSGRFSTCYPHARLLFCLDCGEGTFLEDDGKVICFERGKWLLIPPFLEVRHRHNNSRHLSLHFSYSLLRGMDILSGMKRVRHASAPELLDMVEKMSPDEPLRFLNAANLIVRAVLEKLMPLPETGICNNFKLIRYRRLTEWLHLALDPHVSVAEMARVMKLSEQTFARKFAADTGLTPRRFNENIIIDHAVMLLADGSLSVKEIAEKLHFSNEYYFSRFFKRCMNLPPGKFRKKMQM